MGRKQESDKRKKDKQGTVKVDSRFEKVFVDPAFARIHRRNAATGELEKDSVLYDVLDHVELEPEVRARADALDEEEKFHWDADSTSSESDEEFNERVAEVERLKGKLSEQAWGSDKTKAAVVEQSTARLAVLGLDWLNIKAEDVFVLCHSVIGSPGEMVDADGSRLSTAVKCVSIYVSDLGAVELDREQREGPSLEDLQLIEKQAAELDEFEGELSEVTAIAVRAYEKRRSMFYFAIVECHSVGLADEIYNAIDNMDCDFAIDGVDVRYVPDDITFDTRRPVGVCKCIPRRYNASQSFHDRGRSTTAHLRWDEPEAKREKLLTKRFTDKEIEAMELQEYYADADSDAETPAVDAEKVAEIRRMLLGSAADAVPEIKPKEGEFDLQPIGHEGRDEIEDSDDEIYVAPLGTQSTSESAPRKKKRGHGFGLLTGEPDREGEDGDETAASETEDVSVGEESDDESSKKKPTEAAQRRRERIKAKARAAKLEHKQKKRLDAEASAVISEVAKDKRFAELFTDAKHFVDATEKNAVRKRLRRK